ncbi:MAG: type II toxin-antitoxin system RelE/ParE family toxin [Flavobacterium sp.]|nr:type II toxin-antitoxin system RelE/ParE family toxin [Flavobacterium sp.]
MSYSIISTHRFEKELKRLVKKFPSLKNEFAELIADIIENPESGSFIGNNCYKIRLAIGSKAKGKSGGARVITYLYIETETVYLLSIYDKSEKADLKPNELKDMVYSLELD